VFVSTSPVEDVPTPMRAFALFRYSSAPAARLPIASSHSSDTPPMTSRFPSSRSTSNGSGASPASICSPLQSPSNFAISVATSHLAGSCVAFSSCWSVGI
jgi:hypothetical protein